MGNCPDSSLGIGRFQIPLPGELDGISRASSSEPHVRDDSGSTSRAGTENAFASSSAGKLRADKLWLSETLSAAAGITRGGSGATLSKTLISSGVSHCRASSLVRLSNRRLRQPSSAASSSNTAASGSQANKKTSPAPFMCPALVPTWRAPARLVRLLARVESLKDRCRHPIRQSGFRETFRQDARVARRAVQGAERSGSEKPTYPPGAAKEHVVPLESRQHVVPLESRQDAGKASTVALASAGLALQLGIRCGSKIYSPELTITQSLDIDRHVGAHFASPGISVVYRGVATAKQSRGGLTAAHAIDELDKKLLGGQIATLRSFRKTTIRRFRLQVKIYTRSL